MTNSPNQRMLFSLSFLGYPPIHKHKMSSLHLTEHHFLKKHHQNLHVFRMRKSLGNPLVGRGRDLKLNCKLSSSQCIHKIKAGIEQEVVERQSYCLYHSELFEVVGLLGLDVDINKMKKKKPRVEIGISIIVSMIIPVSVLVVALHLLDAAKVIMDEAQGRSKEIR